MMLPSHAHVELILNGTRIVGWGESDPPYNIDTDDSASLSKGKAGRRYGNGEADHGGRLTFSLAPHSPSVKWLIEREIERKRRLILETAGYAQVFNGTLKDVVTGIDVVLWGGTIIKLPPRTIAGQEYEAIFEFEIIHSNVESEAWAPFGVYPIEGNSGGRTGDL